MFLHIAFWLFIVFVALFIVLHIFNRFANRWGKLPHFIENYVGGNYAICSVADFRNTPSKISETTTETKTVGVHYRFVSQTLVYGNARGNTPERFAGEVTWVHQRGSDFAWQPKPKYDRFDGFVEVVRDPELFVPYTSESHMPFATQARFFIEPYNGREFRERKIKENCAVDFRLRMADRARRWNTEAWQDRITWASAASFILMVGIAFFVLGGEEDQSPIVTHLTTMNGTLTITEEPRKHVMMIPIYEDPSLAANLIVEGKVSNVIDVGAGLFRVSIDRSDKSTDWGFASSFLGLKVGDEAYLRRAMLLQWSNGRYQIETHSGAWFITKADAETLVGTGKFEIVK